MKRPYQLRDKGWAYYEVIRPDGSRRIVLATSINGAVQHAFWGISTYEIVSIVDDEQVLKKIESELIGDVEWDEYKETVNVRIVKYRDDIRPKPERARIDRRNGYVCTNSDCGRRVRGTARITRKTRRAQLGTRIIRYYVCRCGSPMREISCKHCHNFEEYDPAAQPQRSLFAPFPTPPA